MNKLCSRFAFEILATIPNIRRIPPPRVYATIHRRRSTTEIGQCLVYENDYDHEKCLIEEDELREINRRQSIRIELLERDYRQLDDDMNQLQIERDLLIKQKRILQEELERSSHHASANVDLHVYNQKLENECRDLQYQLTLREKEKIDLNEFIADLEVQIKLARDGQEEYRESYNELETALAIETENRQCLEVQLQEAHLRQKENENQIRRLQMDFDEVILSKQEIIKSNYALVQNADILREQLRTARTQAAEVRIHCPSLSTSYDNLDESLSRLIYDNDDNDNNNYDTPDCDQSNHPSSSLFSEINSLETMSNETIKKYLNGSTNDIELDFLLAKTTTLSSSLVLINQLIQEMKILQEQKNDNDQEHLTNMKGSLKHLLENIQSFDTRFNKLQLLLIASREQQQCYRAELDDFYRLVDKQLVPDLELSSNGNQQHRLVSILQAYEQELARLRQIIRTNDETIRSCQRQLIEKESLASRWRMKNTFFEKNQKKLVEKIKELNVERRQLIESSNSKRTRTRRVAPIIQVEQQEKKPLSIPLESSSQPQTNSRLSRSRSLPLLKSVDHGRKSRNDSGVVLSDEPVTSVPLSSLQYRRRIESNHFVMHTSNSVYSRKVTYSIPVNTKPFLTRYSCQFHWFFLLFLLFIDLIILFIYGKYFSL